MTGLPMDTGQAYPVPQAEVDADAGYSVDREAQHLLATTATRDQIAQLETQVAGLGEQLAEQTPIEDNCLGPFDIQILEGGNRQFTCSGYLFINDGRNQYAPISPIVKQTGQRLEDVDCSDGGWAIGSGSIEVWLELELQCPPRDEQNPTCAVVMELNEAYIAWGRQTPEDAENGQTRYVKIARIPGAPAGGGCRTPVLYSPAPAWLLFLCCPPVEGDDDSEDGADGTDGSSGVGTGGLGSNGVPPKPGIAGYYVLCYDPLGKYPKWIDISDVPPGGPPYTGPYNTDLRAKCLSTTDTTIRVGWSQLVQAHRYDILVRLAGVLVAYKSVLNRGEVTITGLTPGTAYDVEVQAHDATLSPGSLISSSDIVCTTAAGPPSSPPAAPPESTPPTADPAEFNVVADGQTDTTVTLRWTELAGSTGYQPYWRPATGGAWTPVAAVAHPTATTVITGLTPATAYNFRILALGHATPTPLDHASATTDPTPISPGEELISGVDNITPTSFRVWWTQWPPGTTHIRMSGTGFPTEIELVGAGEFHYMGLPPGTYEVLVEALALPPDSSAPPSS